MLKRFNAVLVVCAFLMLSVSAGVASANQMKRYSGLYVKDGSGKKLGEIDRTTKANNKVWKKNTDGGGDRMQIQTPWRDRAPGNGKGVHTSVNWAKNGSYCYLSGIGVSKSGGSASVSCSNGWNGAGHSESSDIEDSGWWFVQHKRPYDLYSDSLRGAVHVCQSDWGNDTCSGKRFMGISY